VNADQFDRLAGGAGQRASEGETCENESS